MTQSWWQHRQWRFIADMDRDGTVSRNDLWPWFEWLYLMPGDALIARIGPTPLGILLDLTPKSIGSPASAALSTALWFLAIWLVYAVWAFLVDAANPTYRAERRERRRAEARARRAYVERQRAIYHGRFLRTAGSWLVSGLLAAIVVSVAFAIAKEGF